MDVVAVLWAIFALAVVVTLVLDLGVFHRTAHEVRTREAIVWSVVWIALALVFGALVWWWRGADMAIHYFTAYLIEKSLSVDNIFVFLVIFSYFGVPPKYQHRVLFWGILSAVALRALMIGAGVAAVQRFHWLLYVLGAVLVVAGLRMATGGTRPVDPARNPVLRLATRWFPITGRFAEARFFTRRGGRLVATPLLLVLLAVETTDVVFALDSVPAVLAITLDPMIAYTSNVFAILGLRALYFALAGILPRFHLLHYALAIILVLVGTKMLVADWYRPPTGITLVVVLAVLGGAAFLSLRTPAPTAPPLREERG